VVSLDYRAALSDLFVAAVEFATEDPNVDLVGLLRTPACVTIEPSNGDPRLCVHGAIDSATYVAGGRHHHRYRVVLRPLLQGLALRVRSRIFQEKNTVEILKTVFKDAGLPKEAIVWEMDEGAIKETFAQRPYCVQYRESELDFVTRLLEDEGLFFWFAHSEKGHVCHIAFHHVKLPMLTGEATLEATEQLHAGQETVSELVKVRSVTPDAYRSRDWFFESPDKPTDDVVSWEDEPALEFYEYPGGLIETAAGATRAVLRGQALAVPATKLLGISNCPRLEAGRLFIVRGAPLSFLDGDYLLVEVRYLFRAPATFASENHDSDHAFRCDFEAIPAAVPYRPARRTPKPQIWGLESAVVTGPSGEEIHVDELGRIKVHFYWDREGKIDDKASCWLRVQQQNTAGSMLLPRVGWELSIGFLDGDPDRPIALQKMYNRESMPPYAMPDNKTQSSLQSVTSPGGGATNEIRMQDGAGGMEFFVHASKDFAMKAGNDVTETIAVDTHVEVGLALHTEVGTDEQVTVGSTQSLSVTGDANDDTVGAKTESVGAMDDWGITNDFAVTTGGNRTESIGGLMNVLANQVIETYNANYEKTAGALISFTTAASLGDAVAGSKTETTGAAKIEIIAKGRSEEVGGSKTLTCALLQEKAGKDMTVSASTAFTLNVAGPIVEKVTEAYSLSAGVVTITAAGGAELKVGGTSLSGKGAKLTFKGSSVGGAGGPQLKLKGKIDYKK
jgi:type VI secretion system secreted protein VgrG